MLLAQDSVAKRLDITPETKVLDVGGAGARFEHGKVTIVDIQAPSWPTSHVVYLDICRDPLPFGDDVFDVCICTRTLEDLYNPFLVLDEMRRVARRGYIETPHRGMESSFALSLELGIFPGWGRHRWMFEAVDYDTLKVIPKYWQLMSHDARQILSWRGPQALSFFWDGTYDYYNTETVDREGEGWHRLVDDHNEFVRRHREHITTVEERLAELDGEDALARARPAARQLLALGQPASD